ncbi:MAG: FUSC family membrane protein, partial [Luteimonas sp.]
MLRPPMPASPMLGSLLALKPRDVPVRVAVRNTLAIVVPLAAGLATGHEAAGLAVSTGALNTMFTDQPGPYRLRLQRMLLAAFAAGLAALLGILVGDSLWPLAVAAFAVAFAGGMLVALGPMAGRVGLTSMIVLVITASMEIPRAQAAGVAALICAGGALQALFAIAAWPLQRYRPERFALADVLAQLAATARARPDAAQQPAVSQAAMEALVLLHGDYRARGEAMRAFRVIAEVCERARIDLLALSDLHARSVAPEARRRIGDVLDQAGAVFEALAAAMRSTVPPAGAVGHPPTKPLRVRGLAPHDRARGDRA